MNKSAQRRGIASSAAVQRTMPRLARLGLGLSILACVLPARAEVGTGPRDAPPDLAVLLIRDELVQKELGLRPGQLERIEKILADHDEKIFAFHLQTPKSSATALRGVLERLERRLSAVLTSEQHKRLTQIALQSRGTFGMLSPVVVRQLKLTEEEKKKVKAAAQEAYARRASIAAGNRGDEPSVSAAALEEAKTAEEEALREAIGPERLQKWY